MLNWRKNWKFVPSDNLMCTFPSMCITTASSGQRVFCNYSLGRNLFSIVRSDTACKKFPFGDDNHFSLRKKRAKGGGGRLYTPGDTPGNLWWGCAARFLQILTLFQTKKDHFCKRNYAIIT